MIKDKLNSIRQRTLSLSGDEFKSVKEDVAFLLGYIANLEKKVGGNIEPRIKPDEMHYKVARNWAEFTAERMPWVKANINVYAESIAKVSLERNINGYGLNVILEFIKKHKFWSEACVSPVNLLHSKGGDNLAKIDYILSDLKKEVKKSGASAASDLKNDSWDNPFK